MFESLPGNCIGSTSFSSSMDSLKFVPVINSALQVADKSLARPGRKQATATEDFDVHISYLIS